MPDGPVLPARPGLHRHPRRGAVRPRAARARGGAARPRTMVRPSARRGDFTADAPAVPRRSPRRPYLSVRYTGLDPRVLVLEDNYVRRVHRVDRHERVQALLEAVRELYDLDLRAADEL